MCFAEAFVAERATVEGVQWPAGTIKVCTQGGGAPENNNSSSDFSECPIEDGENMAWKCVWLILVC